VDAKYSRKKTIIRNRNGARKYSFGGGGAAKITRQDLLSIILFVSHL